MILLLLVLTTACDDDALAGAAYRDALEAMNQGKYEEAVGKLQEALRQQPRETDKLFYRDKDGRHKEAYYPHFVWSQVRALQARKEPAAARRRELIRDALTHLDLTAHPDAAAARETLRAELAAAEKALSEPAPEDAAVAALRDRIEQLCDREQFEEALRIQTAERALLDRHSVDRARIKETIETRRSAVIARYEKALELTLERVALSSPMEEADGIPALLRAAALPRSVAEPAEGRFVWLRSFISLCEERLPTLRAVSAGPSHLECADVFEQSAARAVDAGTPAGFRAARSIAQSIRWSRIDALAGGKNDSELEQLLASSRDSTARCRKLLSGRKDFEIVLAVVGAYETRIQRAADRLGERKRFRDELARWIVRAEEILVRPSAMADPEALRSIARAFDPLEAAPTWDAVGESVRARGLWVRSVLEAVSLLLEGESVQTAAERAAPRLRQARALDPNVQALWDARLSPKLRDAFKRIGQ